MTVKKTDNDHFKKLTESLNQSGAFLQVYVQDQLKIRGWQTQPEYPVQFAPFVEEPKNHPNVHAHMATSPSKQIDSTIFAISATECMNKSNVDETSIDVVATRTKDGATFNLCIESKKLDPRFVDWVFIQQEQNERVMRFFNRTRSTQGLVDLSTVPPTYILGIETHLRIMKGNGKTFYHDVADFALALKNQELDRDYYKSDKTKIDDSARQIIEGTYGYIIDRILDHVHKGEPILYGCINDIFIPIVVTNANLYLCKFNVEDIDPVKASAKEVNYEPVDSIIYECAPPKSVQFPDLLSANLTPEQRKYVSKWHILILSPKGFRDFLNSFN